MLLIYTVKSGKSSVIEERKHLHQKYKIHCHLRYGYFVLVHQIVLMTVQFL